MRNLFSLGIIVLIQTNIVYSLGDNSWPGRFFPDVGPRAAHNGIAMGVVDYSCDDGVHNLNVDYNGSATFYTCYDEKSKYLPNFNVHPIIERESIPLGYSAPHYCMNESITYDISHPTFGGHRPLWPKYGEYKYVPVQRWLHNVEHGAVVFLYHPCANGNEVKYLKDVLKNCLYRHIISADQNLTPERPLALISWGYRLEMSKYDSDLVIKFIKKHANHGPEKKTEDGQYDFDLVESAKKVSNDKDNVFCAKFDTALNI